TVWEPHELRPRVRPNRGYILNRTFRQVQHLHRAALWSHEGDGDSAAVRRYRGVAQRLFELACHTGAPRPQVQRHESATPLGEIVHEIGDLRVGRPRDPHLTRRGSFPDRPPRPGRKVEFPEHTAGAFSGIAFDLTR